MPQDWFSANAPKKAQPAPSGDWFTSNAPKKSADKTPPLHPHARTAQVVGNALKGAWNVVKEIPGALYDVAADVAPYDASGNLKLPLGNTSSAIMRGSIDTAKGALDAYRQGDYLTGARKTVNAFPVVGPMLDASTDKMMQGDISEGIGEVITNTALLAGGFRPKGAPVMKPPRMAGPANAKDAAAVRFAKQEGIPLDAATATGNEMLLRAQSKAESSYGGWAQGRNLRKVQDEHLTRVGEEQAAKASPSVTNPLAAGEGVRNVLTKQIETLHQRATGSYDALRALEEAQRQNLPKNPAQLATMDVAARTPLAVDLTEAMRGLEPLYKQLKRESELGIPMQGAKGRTLAALDGLMNGPSVASLSTVDAALSDLKAMARGAEMPELRTTGQATAAQAVQKLDVQVRAAAAKAGPNVLKTLEDGRAATRQKYAVADVLDMLSAEPGQVFRQLTQNKDVGLERLKAVEKFAPQELPKVGRAFLEDAMQQATAEGGFMHADRLWSNWQKLGGETKRRLFSKQQIQDLDNFFLVSKRIKENPNPSGTAKMPRLNFTEVLAGVPAYYLSKMLMTPEGVKWLTEARIVSKSPSKAARALAISNVTKAAQSAGVPLEMIPALTEDAETATPSGTRR